jgi:two-component system sensor histidine kinase QseC
MLNWGSAPWPSSPKFKRRAGLQSLRLRLAAGMGLVFVLALGASSLTDRLAGTRALESEPYQDGLVLACFSAAVLALVWLVSAWSLRPVLRASQEAGLAGPRHPGLRLTSADLPSEIRPLVEAVNGALDRMEAAYEAERRFTADAAHELRTPLSVLSVRLQRARIDGATDWDAVEGDLRQMTHVVTQLLDLARKEQAAREAQAVPVNLSRVAREAAAMVMPLVEAAGRTLEVDVPEKLAVLGRADDLRDLVLNLLDNALTHGEGAISLRGASGGGLCRLDVADEGHGVPSDLHEAVFERFRKARPGSRGTGLGLAIVRQVAESHGGTARFLEGARSIVRVEFNNRPK